MKQPQGSRSLDSMSSEVGARQKGGLCKEFVEDRNEDNDKNYITKEPHERPFIERRKFLRKRDARTVEVDGSEKFSPSDNDKKNHPSNDLNEKRSQRDPSNQKSEFETRTNEFSLFTVHLKNACGKDDDDDSISSMSASDTSYCSFFSDGPFHFEANHEDGGKNEARIATVLLRAIFSKQLTVAQAAAAYTTSASLILPPPSKKSRTLPRCQPISPSLQPLSTTATPSDQTSNTPAIGRQVSVHSFPTVAEQNGTH